MKRLEDGRNKIIVYLILPSGDFLLYSKGSTHLNPNGDELFLIFCRSMIPRYIVTNGKDEKVIKFTWDIRDFPQSLARQRNENKPLTSDVFLIEGQRWRAVLTEDLRLCLQLILSSNPVTAEIR